jgi:hypothetical protein
MQMLKKSIEGQFLTQFIWLACPEEYMTMSELIRVFNALRYAPICTESTISMASILNAPLNFSEGLYF